jgi:dsRNA-specific ribonuclease
MSSRVLASVIWQSHRSGNYICEVYNKENGKYIGVGIGQTKKQAELRAHQQVNRTTTMYHP